MIVPDEFTRLRRSFKAAIEGITKAFIHEKNLHIHGWVSLGVTLLSIWAGIPWWQYLIIFTMIILVFAFELMNTAIETAFDVHSVEHHSLIKKGKDAAAGAVLLVSILSVMVGITILFQPLLSRVALLHDQITTIFVPNAIQLAIMICVWFILFSVIIKWNRKYRYSLIVSFIVLCSVFAVFFWIYVSWMQLIMLLTPVFYVIFAYRGLRTIFGFLQIVVSLYGVYLLYYLLK